MNSITFRNGHVLACGASMPGARFGIADGRLAAVHEAGAADGFEIDLAGGWVLPGFVDAQVNGGGGLLFNNALSVDGLKTIAAAHARYGTTAFLPTLISDTPEAIATALDVVDAAVDAGVPGIVGVHIEGPFINRSRKGIHDASLIRGLDPSVIDLLRRPRRGVRLVTLAPETVSPTEIERLVEAGVVLSAGHSDASYEESRKGFDAGIRGVTHLYNAMSPLQHRAPGMVGAALNDDRVWCGIIADGVHVAPAALNIAFKVKGSEKLMLVTDAMPSVGSADDFFLLNGRRMTVRDGVCQGEDGTLAGAHLNMAQAVRIMGEATGAEMPALSRMASDTPARFLGLDMDRGRLEIGMRADFVMLNAQGEPVRTWYGGAELPAG